MIKLDREYKWNPGCAAFSDPTPTNLNKNRSSWAVANIRGISLLNLSEVDI